MDFRELLSVASNKQKEKELVTTKRGISTNVSNKDNSTKKKVDEAKQKKLDAIRARVEAQMKKPEPVPAKPVKKPEGIMDFTSTGLSENDTRRKSLSEAELARKKKEFLEKVKRLKERPIGSHETGVPRNMAVSKSSSNSTRKSPVAPKNVKSKELCAMSDSDSDDEPQKNRGNFEFQSSSLANNLRPSKEKEPRDKNRSSESKSDRNKHKHKSHKHHKDKESSSSKEKNKDSNRDKHKDKRHDKEKHKSKHSTSEADWVSVKSQPTPTAQPVKKKKPLPKGPPPMSFMELLNVAQENKKNPKAILSAGKKPAVGEKVEKKKKKEPKRPLTQEERERFDRINTPEYQKWLKCGGSRPDGPNRGSMDVSDSESEEESRPSKGKPNYGSSGPSQGSTNSKLTSSSQNRPGLNIRPGNSVSSEALNKGQNPNAKVPRKPVNGTTHKNSPQIKSSKSDSALSNKSKIQGSKLDALKNVAKERSKPPQEATNPFDRIYGQIQKNNPKSANKRKHVIESDEEYDEDLADFIDEDEDMGDFIDDSEAPDISKYISEIFGYDKRKFKHVDEEDLSDMEVGFAGVMKEEIRSGKIGRLEDLEDMRMEEEEIKRKQLLKKKKMKR